MSKLSKLILAMAEDTGLERDFAQDPEAVMARHDLSEEEKAALRSGDEAAISRAAIGPAPDFVYAKLIVVPAKVATHGALRRAA